MMSMMRVKTALPFLLALPLLAMMAVLVYQQPSPAAAQGADPLPAPTVTLTAASVCDSNNPRTFLLASYTAVAGADRYEHRVKWGRRAAYDAWRREPKGPGRPWKVSVSSDSDSNHIAPGETYTVQVRAVDAEGVRGSTATARYAYQVVDFDAPSDVKVSYGTNGDVVDYTRARLTWRGDAGSGGWFAVQQREIGKRWQAGSWQKAEKVDGDGSPYYQDLSGLDVDKGYEFRVTGYTGYTGQCGQASPWSEVATLWPAPDPPAFSASVGRTEDGAMLGVWITSPQGSVDYHTFRLGDGDAVIATMPAAQHVFGAKMGKSYRICATAGNARGESAATCRNITAQPVSPIESISMAPGEQVPGTLNVYWELAPVVNPTWDRPCADGEVSTPEAPCAVDSTHYPPGYRVALREAGTGADEWPNADTDFRVVYQGGQKGGARFNNLKGNTEYEVAVQSLYYGETGYKTAKARTLMNPVRNLVVGFDDDNDGRAVVGWDAPEGGGQTGYVVKLRKTFDDDYWKPAGRQDLGADALGANFDGLKAGRWYHVKVKAVGDGDHRSPVRTCYFQHGADGSQNTVTARWTKGPSCAAAAE